jgi:phage head maturation protease
MNPLKTISKSDTELRVGNYMILFGGRDLAGEFFTKNTRFDSNYTDLGMLYEDFEHGRDPDKSGNDADNVLGIADWKSAKVDEIGIFVERVLNRRAAYMQSLMPLIEMGVIGTSSEAVSGRVRKKSSGEITDWPLMRDSLTVTPMEPRMVTSNVLASVKALAEVFPNSKSLNFIAHRAEAGSSKSIIEAIASLSDVEDYLRDAGGLSRTEAKALVAQVKNLGKRDAPGGDIQVIADALNRRGAILKQREADEGLNRIAAALKSRGATLTA